MERGGEGGALWSSELPEGGSGPVSLPGSCEITAEEASGFFIPALELDLLDFNGRETEKDELVSAGVWVMGFGVRVMGFGGIFCFFCDGPFEESVGFGVLGLSPLFPLSCETFSPELGLDTICCSAEGRTSVMTTSSRRIPGGWAEVASFDSARMANEFEEAYPGFRIGLSVV